LVMNESTGAVNGTPLSAGTSDFTLEVTDSLGATATQDETIPLPPTRRSAQSRSPRAPRSTSPTRPRPASPTGRAPIPGR
jgi:hypothetical protein